MKHLASAAPVASRTTHDGNVDYCFRARARCGLSRAVAVDVCCDLSPVDARLQGADLKRGASRLASGIRRKPAFAVLPRSHFIRGIRLEPDWLVNARSNLASAAPVASRTTHADAILITALALGPGVASRARWPSTCVVTLSPVDARLQGADLRRGCFTRGVGYPALAGYLVGEPRWSSQETYRRGRELEEPNK